MEIGRKFDLETVALYFNLLKGFLVGTLLGTSGSSCHTKSTSKSTNGITTPIPSMYFLVVLTPQKKIRNLQSKSYTGADITSSSNGNGLELRFVLPRSERIPVWYDCVKQWYFFE
jgi:hypothetical protein